jgi:hypothetical protein
MRSAYSWLIPCGCGVTVCDVHFLAGAIAVLLLFALGSPVLAIAVLVVEFVLFAPHTGASDTPDDTDDDLSLI